MSLRLEHVTQSYDRRAGPVISDVSLVVHPGASIAFMGPSGSGKTTLLAIMGLLLTPTSGQVTLDGMAVNSRTLPKLPAETFGWVFQAANALAHRTAGDNAALGLLAGGASVGAAMSASLAALEALGIGHLFGQPAHRLSGGELQRVCIARALAAKPRFILADEPTGQLDRATTDAAIDALITGRPALTSVVIATHDPDVARRCDRVLRISDGQLLEDSS